jgi:uncharacterized membrane protein
MFPIDLLFRLGYVGAALWVVPYYLLTKKKTFPAKVAALANWIAAFYALCLSLLAIVMEFYAKNKELSQTLLVFFLPLATIVVLAFLFKRKPIQLMLPFCLLLNFSLIYAHIIFLFVNRETDFGPMTDSDKILEAFFQEPAIFFFAIPFEFLLWLVYVIAWWVEKVSRKQTIPQPDAP